MLGEHLAGPADQPGRRLVAGSGQEVDVAEDLVPGQPAASSPSRPRTRPGAARSSGRPRGAPPASRCTPRTPLACPRLRRSCAGVRHACPLSRRRPSSMRSRMRLLVLLGDAEQHADGPHGHLGAEVADEVEPAAARPAGRGCGRRTRGPWARWPFIFRGVKTRESRLAVEVVAGGILEDDRARRDLDAALDELEDRALAPSCRSSSRPSRARRRRSGSGRRSRSARCSRAAARRAAASRPGTGRCRSRSRTGRSRGRSLRSSSQSPPWAVGVMEATPRAVTATACRTTRPPFVLRTLGPVASETSIAHNAEEHSRPSGPPAPCSATLPWSRSGAGPVGRRPEPPSGPRTQEQRRSAFGVDPGAGRTIDVPADSFDRGSGHRRFEPQKMVLTWSESSSHLVGRRPTVGSAVAPRRLKRYSPQCIVPFSPGRSRSGRHGDHPLTPPCSMPTTTCTRPGTR